MFDDARFHYQFQATDSEPHPYRLLWQRDYNPEALHYYPSIWYLTNSFMPKYSSHFYLRTRRRVVALNWVNVMEEIRQPKNTFFALHPLSRAFFYRMYEESACYLKSLYSHIFCESSCFVHMYINEQLFPKTCTWDLLCQTFRPPIQLELQITKILRKREESIPFCVSATNCWKMHCQPRKKYTVLCSAYT